MPVGAGLEFLCRATSPEPRRQRLRIGGRLVLPLESRAGSQELVLIERTSETGYRSRAVLAVRFVPFTRAGDVEA